MIRVIREQRRIVSRGKRQFNLREYWQDMHVVRLAGSFPKARFWISAYAGALRSKTGQRKKERISIEKDETGHKKAKNRRARTRCGETWQTSVCRKGTKGKHNAAIAHDPMESFRPAIGTRKCGGA